MIIKQAAEREHDINELNALLELPHLDANTQKQINREIRNIRSGMKGEKEAAYQIDFYYKDSKNWMVIHDLRLELDGHTAQIDHLLINRFMEIYVCESKHFGEGIAINEYGEFSAFYQGRAYGIPSPIEQNNRHIKVLNKLFDSSAVSLPTRLGLKMKPKLCSLILIADSARIRRPKNNQHIEHLDRIIKTEQIQKRINKDLDDTSLSSLLGAAKIISRETLQAFAEDLAALHRAHRINWPKRFGIAAQVAENVPSAVSAPKAAPEPQPQPQKPANHLFCAACKKGVSQTVAAYCWNNKARFQGKVYCFNCQKYPAAHR